MNKKSLLLFLTTSIFFSPLILAKTINLYAQPKTDAKVLSTLDLDKPVSITIINKGKEWTSIVDPTVAPLDARIAWVKTENLPTNNYTFTQTMVNSGKGPQGYTVEYGVPKPLSAEQAAKIAKQIELQQQAIENYFSTMTRNMFNNMHQVDMSAPFILPVIVMPTPAVAPAAPAQNKPAANKQTGVSVQKQN